VSETVTLEDFDDWIWGIDVTDDNWFTFVTSDGIRWHDIDGNYLNDSSFGYTVGYGISCLVQ
jgi:hypothetical protein